MRLFRDCLRPQWRPSVSRKISAYLRIQKKCPKIYIQFRISRVKVRLCCPAAASGKQNHASPVFWKRGRRSVAPAVICCSVTFLVYFSFCIFVLILVYFMSCYCLFLMFIFYFLKTVLAQRHLQYFVGMSIHICIFFCSC